MIEQKIKFSAHSAAQNFLFYNSDAWDTIVILNSGTIVPVFINNHSKSVLSLIFDDIDYPLGNYIMPSKTDVRRAINFCRGKEKLLVTCYGGQSRSAAIAYVAKCIQCGSPHLAIGILEPINHYPNRLVVKLASEILDNREIFDVYAKWLTKPVFFPPSARKSEK